MSDDVTFKILNLTPMEGEALRIISGLINLDAGEDPIRFAEDMAVRADEPEVAAACRSLAMKLSALRKSVAH